MARTAHALAVDPIHDEIVVPNPFAQALLFFRGGASGEEKPIRIIQGPKTMLGYTDDIEVDPVHNEVFAPQFRSDAILVFAREPGGDVAPIRILHGPKTKLDRPAGVWVDPVNNLLAVVTIGSGLLIFNRTDNGDVAPRWIIAGSKTGLATKHTSLPKVLLYPEKKLIFVPAYVELTPGGAPLRGVGGKRVNVWNYGDTGNVPPWAILTSSPKTEMEGVSRVVINKAAKELIVLGSGEVFVYHMPDVL